MRYAVNGVTPFMIILDLERRRHPSSHRPNRTLRTILYRQNRDRDSFLRSNRPSRRDSVSRTNYLRILALASIDVLVTLPIGIMSLVLNVLAGVTQDYLPFYAGWTDLHTDWDPISSDSSDLRKSKTSIIVQFYFAAWSSPVLAFVIFGLFGLTKEARASYWRIVCTVGGWLGWKPSPHVRGDRPSLRSIQFGVRTQDSSETGLDTETRCAPSICVACSSSRLKFAAQITLKLYSL